MDRLELVTRNVEEVVTMDELKKLLDEKPHPTVYVGYEPSGNVHLGHMITVNKLIDCQKAGLNVTVLLADLHAYLNRKGTMEEIEKIAEYNKRCFIALGLSEESTRFVLGSSYQLSPEYEMNVLRMACETTVNRARRSMDEVSRDAEDPHVSQMIYPLMQAIDIAFLGVDVAMGGIDQRKIHMIAREELPMLGFKSPVCLHTPILLGLDGTKMSSSKGNNISVDEPAESVAKKIEKAFCPMGVVENNPVLDLFRYHIFIRYPAVTIERPEKHGGSIEYLSFEALKGDFAAKKVHPLDLKKAAAKYMNMILEPVRKRV
ncbi:tyrosyl-tRNA synthetase [Methanocella conradii HZ254]|uniref:Tyrosine--tRNA ligase n=1 Tax=Methanocella conradii (strain DSM 24694 / JCM 17849 / CGMCC 1.5162 / HZ254) TaxID=1041930 RepID=H8I9G3_METCZ|nr:tyrosine--tRNA ligase [Methanocella conradii]AFD00008.1 tyrosyl-tRNA synthetase [Methanocella conradii HZ254]MDI6897352.1 tyrosine--tRNA ligase [Methanocella conradii]